MKIKVSKELNRLDLGVIEPDSILECNPIVMEDSKKIMFPIKLYVSQSAMDSKVSLIGGCQEFKQMRLSKSCSESEWAALNEDAGSRDLVCGWFKAAIDDVIGVGFTEII
tara:strand:+ start:2349 stop:2678 length:330 start_codon:yes stop_codon:yes gene_type:complete